MTKGDKHLGAHQEPPGGLSNLPSAELHPEVQITFDQVGNSKGFQGQVDSPQHPSTFAPDVAAQ